MMQASLFWFRYPNNAGLHHQYLKFSKICAVGTWVCRETLGIEEIYDAGQCFGILRPENAGLHHKFLKFLRFPE